ncbi:MAG: PAS domain S-box protein [Desulfobacterales bacterium]|nr:PAS domain S-box protein [Desulfobacterales bacterium]
MGTHPSKPQFQKLKKAAEDIIQKKGKDIYLEELESDMDLKSLLHDLQVYQVELEVQNNELKQAQQELEIAKEHYFQLFNQIPVGYISVDSSGIILKSNQAFQEMIQQPFSRLYRRPFLHFIEPADQNAFLGHFQQFIQNKERHHLDVQLRAVEGKQLDVQLDVKILERPREYNQGQDIILISVVDVTEKKQIQRALREHRNRLETIIEDIPAMVCRFNAKGIILYSNNDFDHIYKTGAYQGADYNFFELIPQEQRDFIQMEFLSLTPPSPTKVIEFSTQKDGEERHHRWAIRTIFDDENSPVAYQLAGQDVTEELRILKEREEKEKLQSLVELSGAVCHELRQPLQVVVGRVELISMDLNHDKHLLKDIEELKKQILRINAALNQLDHITRYKTRSYVGDVKIIDLKKACERRKYPRYSPKKPLSIEFTSPGLPAGEVIDLSKGGVSFRPPRENDYMNGEEALQCRIMDQARNILVDDLWCTPLTRNPMDTDVTQLPAQSPRHRMAFQDPGKTQLLGVEKLLYEMSPL